MYVVSNLVLQEDLCIWVGRVNGLHRGASPCGGSATLFKLFYVLCYSNLYTHYFQVRPPLLHTYNEPKFGYPPFSFTAQDQFMASNCDSRDLL